MQDDHPWHTCPRCEAAAEAIPERCPDFRFDWEYAYAQVNELAATKPDITQPINR